MTKNHDLEVVKKYIEGALSVESQGNVFHEGYLEAMKNVYNFIKLVEKRER